MFACFFGFIGWPVMAQDTITSTVFKSRGFDRAGYSGFVSDHHENGNIWSITYYHQGKKNGPCQQFHENGQIAQSGHYRKDRMIGKWEVWQPNGMKLYEHTEYGGVPLPGGPYRYWYRNGHLKSRGDTLYYFDMTGDTIGHYRSGKFEEYHSNGQMRTQEFYHRNEPTGTWEYFDTSGQLIGALHCRQGKKWEGKYVLWQEEYLREIGYYHGGAKDSIRTTYYASGQQEYRMTYKAGLLEGPVTYHAKTGKPIHRGSYARGMPDGLWIYYDKDGYKESERTFSSGSKTGEWIHYYPSGKVSKKVVYVNDRLHGSFETWHQNGRVHATGQAVEGKYHGLWTYWDENGQKTREDTYDMGSLTESKDCQKDK